MHYASLHTEPCLGFGLLEIVAMALDIAKRSLYGGINSMPRVDVERSEYYIEER